MSLEKKHDADEKNREIQQPKPEKTDNNLAKQEFAKDGKKLDNISSIGKKDETDTKKENLEQKEKGKEKQEAVPGKDKELKQGQDVKNIEGTGNQQDAGKNREQEHLKNGQKLDENYTIPDNKRAGFFHKLADRFSKRKEPQDNVTDNVKDNGIDEPKTGSFEGLSTAPDPSREGNTVIRGKNFEDYKNCDDGFKKGTVKREGYKLDESPVEFVDPSKIEGISLTPEEAKEPSAFWNQKEKGNPYGDDISQKDGWLRTASRIPDVKERLNQGEKLEDLVNDKDLGPCARQYFDREKMPRVTQLPNGGYELGPEGRHRVLAARLCGQEIPVLVIGKYKDCQ